MPRVLAPVNSTAGTREIRTFGRIILSATLRFYLPAVPENDGLFINDLSLSTRETITRGSSEVSRLNPTIRASPSPSHSPLLFLSASFGEALTFQAHSRLPEVTLRERGPSSLRRGRRATRFLLPQNGLRQRFVKHLRYLRD